MSEVPLWSIENPLSLRSTLLCTFGCARNSYEQQLSSQCLLSLRLHPGQRFVNEPVPKFLDASGMLN